MSFTKANALSANDPLVTISELRRTSTITPAIDHQPDPAELFRPGVAVGPVGEARHGHVQEPEVEPARGERPARSSATSPKRRPSNFRETFIPSCSAGPARLVYDHPEFAELPFSILPRGGGGNEWQGSRPRLRHSWLD